MRLLLREGGGGPLIGDGAPKALFEGAIDQSLSFLDLLLSAERGIVGSSKTVQRGFRAEDPSLRPLGRGSDFLASFRNILLRVGDLVRIGDRLFSALRFVAKRRFIDELSSSDHGNSTRKRRAKHSVVSTEGGCRIGRRITGARRRAKFLCVCL
ncbi:hypothetical protein [Methylorubrum salsuginis]|uniref:hypothetical protein n=1 Tax=Methylorubrum salsuginis TaxID=414703 RepID=UPI0013F4D176|nr:hypothetical protein [Methylorubrum salsuginis]